MASYPYDRFSNWLLLPLRRKYLNSHSFMVAPRVQHICQFVLVNKYTCVRYSPPVLSHTFLFNYTNKSHK